MQEAVQRYKNGRWAIMRKNYTDLHTTTVRSFQKMFPPELVVSKNTDVWRCVNGNELWFYAADKSRDADYEKTRGLEVSGIMVDEMSQLDEEFYEIAPSLLRHEAFDIRTGAAFHGFVYGTTNPIAGQHWIKRLFVKEQTRIVAPSHVYIPALPDANPLLPENYIDTAFSTMSEPMLRMLRYGDWDVEEADFKIVLSHDVEAITVTDTPAGAVTDGTTTVALGIDIGLGRPDETVVYGVTRDGVFYLVDAFQEYDTMRQVERLYGICQNVHRRDGKIAIDAGAVGKGVADRLREAFHGTIIPVMFDERPDDEGLQATTVRYANKRAQMYFAVREYIQRSAAQGVDANGRREITIIRDEMLLEELENTYYRPEKERLMLEPKDDIRKRLRRSPDRADAFALAAWAFRNLRRSDVLAQIPKILAQTRANSGRARTRIRMPGD